MITLKLATSLDGRIATAQGESRWITGPESRRQVHLLRADHDAVVVGAGTALADDPELTVRLDGFDGPQPARVVLDSRQRLSPSSRLAQTARQTPTYVVSPDPLSAPLQALGVRGLQAPSPVIGRRPDLTQVVSALVQQGLHRLFIEGGGEVAASLLRLGLADRVEWFRAPIILGAEGRPAVAELDVARLPEAPRLRRVDIRVLGDDLWESYERI